MNDPVILRKKVREILAMAPRRRFSEQMILDSLSQLVPEPVSVPVLLSTLEWNHARNLIEFRFNEDSERNEWFLTDQGKQKEGL
jgi:hypothetical protein